MITDSKFRCTVTGKTYFIKGNLSCYSCNVICLVTYSNCREQYVGSAIDFKQRFRIRKSDIKTNKDLCGAARHLNNKCCSPNNNHAYLKIQIIQQVFNSYQTKIVFFSSKEVDNDELLKEPNLIFCKNLNFWDNWENLVRQVKLTPTLYKYRFFQYKIYSNKLSLLTEYGKIQ